MVTWLKFNSYINDNNIFSSSAILGFCKKKDSFVHGWSNLCMEKVLVFLTIASKNAEALEKQ